MLDNLKIYATVPLRWGVAFVFLYFGLGKFLAPAGNIAQFADIGVPPALAPAANYVSGALELFVSIAMFTGVFVRQAAILASLMLGAIIGSFTLKFGKLGFDSVFRDVAILGATLSLILKNRDPWSLQKKTWPIEL